MLGEEAVLGMVVQSQSEPGRENNEDPSVTGGTEGDVGESGN